MSESASTASHSSLVSIAVIIFANFAFIAAAIVTTRARGEGGGGESVLREGVDRATAINRVSIEFQLLVPRHTK